MAVTYGLLRLPKMPELKNRDLSDFRPLDNDDLDITTIPYKDKARETIRKQKLEQYKTTGTIKSIVYVGFVLRFLFFFFFVFQEFGQDTSPRILKKQRNPGHWPNRKRRKEKRRDKKERKRNKLRSQIISH